MWFTTAHEIFHLVQNAYLPLEKIPDWIKEGTTNANMLNVMADRTQPTSLTSETDTWMRYGSWRSLFYSSRFGECEHCYGATLFWFYYQLPQIASGGGCHDSFVTTCMFELLAARYRTGGSIGTGAWALEQAVPLWRSDSDLGSILLGYAEQSFWYLGPGASVVNWRPYQPRGPSEPKPVSVSLRAYDYAIEPLAVHRVSIPVPPSARGRHIEFTTQLSGPDYPLLHYGGSRGVRVTHTSYDASKRVYVWDVDTSLTGAACRGIGAMWEGTLLLPPEQTCQLLTLDLVVFNYSTKLKGSYRFSYRLLPDRRFASWMPVQCWRPALG